MPTRPKEPHAVDPRKLASGRWQALVTFWDPETGKRREVSQTFDTDREALRWGRAREQEFLQSPNGTVPTQETLGEYLAVGFPRCLHNGHCGRPPSCDIERIWPTFNGFWDHACSAP